MPPVHDSWVFQPIDDGLNSLAIYFWQNKIQCFELPRVMWQQDTQLIEILNKFRKIHQTQQDIDIINIARQYS